MMNDTAPHELSIEDLAVLMVGELQRAMQSILLMFQSMRMLPAQIADAVTQRILEDPLAATAPQAPPGWVPPSLSPPGGGHWSGGAYFEDGNVLIPGGPALVNGQFYIPGA